MSEFWESLNTRRKLSFVIALIIILLFSAILAALLLKKDYVALFGDLNDTDAARIVDQLESLQIDYRLSDAGKTILVQEGSVYDARLKLTSSGALNNTGVGFELFDESEYGMTEFAQKINYQRALQGEIARTISSLDKVRLARVHLVLPESSLFRRQELEASASVTVFLNDGTELNNKEIRGIQQLVASSVQDLSVDNIVVLNQIGQILSRNVSNESELENSRLDKKMQVEAYLKEKINEIVDNVYGSGASVVNVDVTLNYDQIQRHIETVIPVLDNAGRPIESRSIRTKSIKPSIANIVNDDPGQPSAIAESSTESTETEYDFGKSIEEQVLSQGSVSKITISVLVPESSSETDILNISKLIAAATGVDFERGDFLEVAAVSRRDLMSSLPATSIDEVTALQRTTTAVVEPHSFQTESQPNSWKNLKLKFGDFTVSIVTLISVLFLILVVVLVYIVSGVRSKSNKLSDEEREQMLHDIKAWLTANDENTRMS